MLGKTHMMVGIAVTLAITHPDTLSGFVTAAGIGAIGALISDIDVGTSSSHRDANRVIFLTIAVAVIFLAVDYFGKFGLVQTILQDSSIVRILLGIALFLVVCAFGKETPHRSFMHSFTALAALDFFVFKIEKLSIQRPPLILSHILIIFIFRTRNRKTPAIIATLNFYIFTAPPFR